MSNSKPRIQFAPNGPILIEGLAKMQDKDGEVSCQQKMALCRCGGSQNKPFCDGTHWHVKFDEAAG